jgi:hypothetical protein
MDQDPGLIEGILIQPIAGFKKKGNVLKNLQNSESQNLNLKYIALICRTLPLSQNNRIA